MEKYLSHLAGALLVVLGLTPAPAQQLSPNMPLDVANLPKPSAEDWNGLAWQSFVASNWPGIPDPSQLMGAVDPAGVSVPVLWMTSKGVTDVFLDKGAPPDPNWQTQVAATACQSLPGYDPATSYVLGLIAKTSPIVHTEINQAPFPGSEQVVGPLIDQSANYVRYDIRMSQSEFAYFLNYRYYNADEQIAAVTANPTTFQPPPRSGQEPYLQNLPPSAHYGTIEYKASWRVLDPKVDIVSRYFTASAFIVNPDGTCIGPQLVGLTGLHILRLTPSTPATWFWASFEQVDNITVPSPPPTRPDGRLLTPTFGDGKTYVPGYSYAPAPVDPGKPLPPPQPVGVSRLTPIQDTSIPVTKIYQGLLAGTVWQNYELIGVQFPVNPIQNGQPQGNAQGTGQCYVAGNDHATDAAAQINDCYLANTSMETYVQSTSCATCHSYGAPLGVQRTSRGRPTFNALDKFQILTFMLMQAQAPPN
jgi:hypothetical protein